MKTCWAACRTACRIMTRFQGTGEDVSQDRCVLLAMPLIGTVIGVVLWLLALLIRMLAGSTLGLLTAAVGIPLLLWWLNRGRGLDALIALLEDWDESGAAAPSAVYWKLCAFQGLLAVKIVGVGFLLSRGQALWLVPVAVLSATTLAGLLRPATATDTEANTDWVWFRRSGHWLIGMAVTLIAAGLAGAFAAGVFAVVGAWLLVPALERLLESPAADWSEPARCAAVELTEYAVIAVGVIYWAN